MGEYTDYLYKRYTAKNRKYKYIRTVSLFDAIVCKRQKFTLSFNRGSEDMEGRRYEWSVLSTACDIASQRGIKLKKYLLGRYYNNAYIYAHSVITNEYTLKDLCERWENAELQMAVARGLKWKHYYEKRGITHAFFNGFILQLAKCRTGVDVSILIFKTKAKLKKNGTI